MVLNTGEKFSQNSREQTNLAKVILMPGMGTG